LRALNGRHALVRNGRTGVGHGAALTVIDQLISSASNFTLGVLIARAGGAEGLGTFGVAFLIWLAVVGTNRALVTEPMTVIKPTEGRQASLAEGLLASLVLGVVAAILLATADVVLALFEIEPVALLALAPCIPSLLAHDYNRATAFRLQRPERALFSDIGFALVQGVGSVALLVLDVTNTAAFIAVWGLGATVGALIGIGLNRIRPTTRGGVALLRDLWPRSRWFLAEFGTAFPADQGYLFLLPILLGTSQFGLYRAGAGLIGPIVVVFIAGGNIGLPESVRRLRRDGMRGLAAYAPLLTAVIVAVTVLYCGLVAIFASEVLRLTYGAEFAGAVTITRLIAAQYLLLALSFGFGQAAKAAGRMRQLWATRAVSAAISITSLVLLVHAFGLVGAGLASMTAGAAYSVGVIVAYRRIRDSHLSGIDSTPTEPRRPGTPAAIAGHVHDRRGPARSASG
jgi:O-antigen/teichoic acid export membrane protein